MAEKKRFKFVIMDSSILRDGWRYEMAGYDPEPFSKNPIGLFMHKREDEWDRDKAKEGSQIVAKWEDITIENGVMTGWAVFDSEDEFAAKIEGKVERGFIHSVSAGIFIKEYTFDDAFALPGQSGPTITKWTIGEVSFVDIPNNPNSVRAYNSFGSKFDFQNVQNVQKMAKATPEQVNALLAKGKEKGLINNANEASFKVMAENDYENAKKFIEAKAVPTPDQVNALIASGKEKGLINNENEASFKALAEIDYENTAKFIGTVPSRVKLADVARNNAGTNTDAFAQQKDETDAAYFNRLQMNAPEKLAEIKKNSHEQFVKLATAYANAN